MPTQLTPTLAPSSASCENSTVFSTELGWMAIRMHGNVLHRLSFGHRDPQSAAAAIESCAANRDIGAPDDDLLRDLVDRLTAYAAGHFDEFLDIETETSHLSPFSKAVIEEVRRIPFGETRSYGDLAALVGRRRAARAVGRVMAQNRTPLVVPCHRVVGRGGLIGGFSAVDGLAMKRRLLQLEALSAVAAR